MTRTVKGHFDGKAIIPDDPVDLPQNQRLIIHIEPDRGEEEPAFGTSAYLAKHLEPMSNEDAEEIRRAIAQGREGVDDHARDVNLD